MPGLSGPNAVTTYLVTDGARVLAWDACARAKDDTGASVSKTFRHDRDVASIVASIAADAREATRVSERTARAMSDARAMTMDERWAESRSEATDAFFVKRSQATTRRAASRFRVLLHVLYTIDC